MSIDPAVGTQQPASRIGTRSPYDFAYWASTFVASGYPDDYLDFGPETDGVALVTWAAQQVGIAVPPTYFGAVITLSESIVPIETALVTRGAVLVGVDQIAVCMGLEYVVGIVNGRYFQFKTTAASTNPEWEYGALIPGLLYG